MIIQSIDRMVLQRSIHNFQTRRIPAGTEHVQTVCTRLNQMSLSISRCSRIVAAPSDVLNKIVAALEY